MHNHTMKQLHNYVYWIVNKNWWNNQKLIDFTCIIMYLFVGAHKSVETKAFVIEYKITYL